VLILWVYIFYNKDNILNFRFPFLEFVIISIIRHNNIAPFCLCNVIYTSYKYIVSGQSPEMNEEDIKWLEKELVLVKN
jgi:hypothetical protein